MPSLTHSHTPPDAAGERTERSLLGRLVVSAGLAAIGSVVFLLLVLLVLSNWEPLESLDQSVASSLHRVAIHRAGLVSFLGSVATLSQPTVFRVIVALVAIWLWVKGARRLAIWAVVTMGIGTILAVVLKIVVARARPSFPSPVAHAGGYSFPSGHALNSMLGVGVLLLIFLPLLGRVGRAVAVTVGTAVVLLTGYDRVALGVHYVSDVLAGWIVALGVLAATTTAFQTWRRDRGERTAPLKQGLDPDETTSLTSP